ncbi:ABC transporter substrate-binding protein [Algisphaera agarilytica]|uniref:ABC-type Fe3+ transport system substrate-binding protein n=1 Tax=Algisphaera agarilytica TaxID=1385975 RepID=A0A7X0H9F0_9BACT|nr:extracellular solute-binding protein [Algisphaera agarilytica]MBB6431651.1 ABC-type Fe3+ transport system substrate-binding protein [Algisphaera agarilytica]
MREHLAKIVIVTLMLLVVGVPFLLRPNDASGKLTDSDGAGERLIIYTPHNEQIRLEMSHAFNAWRGEQGLSPVKFDWRASGGTSDLRKTILAQFEAKAKKSQEDSGIGADLFFGGGEYDHNKLASGLKIKRDGEEVKIAVAVPADIPQAVLDEAFPQALIGGEQLYHPDKLWIGTALSSFGIVYNRDLLVMLDLKEPTTWADLTDPAYQNWVALADPGHSGSIGATFNTLLKRTGWTEGWAVMRRVFANARYFASAASKVPVDVSSGEAAAGMCIDFYGRTQAGAIAAAGWSGDTEGQGMSRVGYADPVVDGKSMTATTADPVSLLRGAPHRETAEQFITWLLSKESQRLWQAKLDTEGGPIRYELRRQPIRADLYTAEEKATWSDPQIDPYPTAVPIMPGMPDFFSAVSPVSQAMAIDVHQDLIAAWRAILRTPDDHPDKPEMLRLFDEMPPELTLTWPDEELANDWQSAVGDVDHPRHSEAAGVLADFMDRFRGRDDDQKLKDKLAWTLFFRDNYRQIASMGR